MDDSKQYGEGLKPEAMTWAHVVPFVAWLFFMQMLDLPSLTPAIAYAIRTVLCLGLFLALRPWRAYAPLRVKNLPLAALVGVVVFVLWVGMEAPWVKRHAPGLADFYERYLVGLPFMGFGRLREAAGPFPYDPMATGWGLFAIHMVGTSLVIAAIEEFFWRGFLYRWMLGRNFLTVDLGRLEPRMFVLVAAFFAVEHTEWFAGLLCGLIYGWLIIRTRDIWAGVVAHAVTNYLLGWYVVATGSYQFW